MNGRAHDEEKDAQSDSNADEDHDKDEGQDADHTKDVARSAIDCAATRGNALNALAISLRLVRGGPCVSVTAASVLKVRWRLRRPSLMC